MPTCRKQLENKRNWDGRQGWWARFGTNIMGLVRGTTAPFLMGFIAMARVLAFGVTGYYLMAGGGLLLFLILVFAGRAFYRNQGMTACGQATSTAENTCHAMQASAHAIGNGCLLPSF